MMTVLKHLAWCAFHRRHSPKGEFDLAPEITREAFRVLMPHDCSLYEHHSPAARRHAIGELGILAARDGKRDVVSTALDESIAPKSGRVSVDEIDKRLARH